MPLLDLSDQEKEEEVILFDKSVSYEKSKSPASTSLEFLWFNRDKHEKPAQQQPTNTASESKPYWRRSSKALEKNFEPSHCEKTEPAVITVDNPIEHKQTTVSQRPTLEENKKRWKEFMNSFANSNNNYNIGAVLRQQSEPIFRKNREPNSSTDPNDVATKKLSSLPNVIDRNCTLIGKDLNNDKTVVDELLAVDEHESGRGMQVLKPNLMKDCCTSEDEGNSSASGKLKCETNTKTKNVDMLTLVPSEHSRSRTSLWSANTSAIYGVDEWASSGCENEKQDILDVASSSTYEQEDCFQAARELGSLPRCASQEILRDSSSTRMKGSKVQELW